MPLVSACGAKDATATNYYSTPIVGHEERNPFSQSVYGTGLKVLFCEFLRFSLADSFPVFKWSKSI